MMISSIAVLFLLSSWNMWRGNETRTGYANGISNFSTSFPGLLSHWETEAGDIRAAPLLHDEDLDGMEDIYISGYDGTAPSVSLYRGYDAMLLWQTGTDGFVAWSTPALLDMNSDGHPEAFVGFHDRGLTCYNGANGSTIWSVELDTFFCSSPLAFFDPAGSPRLAVAGNSGTLYYLNAINGDPIWSFAGSDTPWSGPALGDPNGDGNPEIVYTTQTHIYVLSLDGTLLWTVSPGTGLSCAALANMDGVPGDEIVVYDGRGGNVSVFGCGNPTPLWSYTVGPFAYSLIPAPSPAIGDVNANGVVDVVIHNGTRAFCLEEGLPLWSIGVSSPDLFTSSPVLADLDGASTLDGGQLEVVISGEDTSQAIGVIYYIQSNGVRVWRWSDWNYTFYPNYNEVALGDPDGDGLLEIVSVDESCYAVILDGRDPLDSHEGLQEGQFSVWWFGQEIHLQIPYQSLVSLGIYDGAGRLIWKHEGVMSRGQHSLSPALGDGVFFAMLRYPGGVSKKKIVVK